MIPIAIHALREIGPLVLVGDNTPASAAAALLKIRAIADVALEQVALDRQRRDSLRTDITTVLHRYGATLADLRHDELIEALIDIADGAKCGKSAEGRNRAGATIPAGVASPLA